LEGIRASDTARSVNEVLGMVGLAERRDHLPSQLSGGEQQRVAIARALVTEPAIILADEPTGNLDSANGERIIAVLRQLVDQHGQTVVLVTHDPSVAQRADRVIHVRDGRICDDYDPRRSGPLAAQTAEHGR
jgi:putative ABC transport system ATP-binding protein